MDHASSSRSGTSQALRAHASASQGTRSPPPVNVFRRSAREALRRVTARFSGEPFALDEGPLRKRYVALSAWPADAQLGLGVIAWSLGSGFSNREFRAAVNEEAPDFMKAAEAAAIGQDPTSITLLGIARSALRNGAAVLAHDLDPEIVYWPIELTRCSL